MQHFGVGSLPWSPLARGAAARPYKNQQRTARADADFFMSPDMYLSDWSGGKAIVDRVEEIAKKKGVTMAQVSLAWVLAQDGKYLNHYFSAWTYY